MKKLAVLVALVSFTFGFAQNEDKMTKTVTTKTKVKSSQGEDVSIKKQKYEANQELEVENNNRTNQAVRRKPTKIEETTSFAYENEMYSIAPDKKGYVMTKDNNGRPTLKGKIRKMPDREFYIMNSKNGNAFGYFDNDGNFIVEKYDSETDEVVVEKYELQKK